MKSQDFSDFQVDRREMLALQCLVPDFDKVRADAVRRFNAGIRPGARVFDYREEVVRDEKTGGHKVVVSGRVDPADLIREG